MAFASAGASLMLNIELATGRRASRVDAADNRLPHLALQGDTARRAGIGALQAHQLRCETHCQGDGHAFSPGVSTAGELDGMEINPESGTTGAAAKAGAGVIRHAGRP